MRFKLMISYAFAVVALIASSNLCDARPHAHGALNNLRRFIRPSTSAFNSTDAAAVRTPPCAQESASHLIPIFPASTRVPVVGLDQANSSIAATLQRADSQPGPRPLQLVMQDERQILHQDAHPIAQHHGSHHQHTKKGSRPLSTTTEENPRSTSASPNVQVTRITLVPRYAQTASSNPNIGGYQSWVLHAFSNPPSASPSSVARSIPASLCPDNNGTVFRSSSGITYQTICGINYDDNIRPFLLVDSFEACIQKCDAYNYDTHGVSCMAALFVPSRLHSADDCYLKSSIARPSIGTGSVEGAVRYSVAQSAHLPVSRTSTSLLSSLVTASSTISGSSSSPSQTSSQALSSASGTVSPPGVTYGTGNSVVAPKVGGAKLHGPSENRPTSQYIQYDPAPGVSLARSLLRVGVNGDLSTGYDISPQTGILDVNIYTQNTLAPLKNVPHISRDGGRGGFVNGQHLFLFCDTGSYSGTTSAQNGDFLDFVSSSVAVDVGMNALAGNLIHLQDGIGEWSDNVGRQRGFAPLTQGEQAYNIAMQGQGQRYAVWIESSIIPLDAERGIIYAPIIYDEVNMVTRAAKFTYTGNTLLTITAGGRGGPVAQRPVRKLFQQDEPEWGVVGGLRSWGPSGIGGTDGKVYLFGSVDHGILMARVAADSITDRDAYEFWTGKSWSTIMPGASSNATWIEGPIMDIDVFYSPRHMTFIAVYLTIYADSTFYYRYLKADRPIIPCYAPGGDKNSDYVENLLRYDWSDEQVLYKAKPGLAGGFIYAGGVHTRYFGSDDVANGGSRMLLSWTAPTGQNPASAASEYQIVTAEVNFT
ncbi:MAG: hypothetical protein Q9223_007273 [Gallowayella weberi]